MKRLLWLALLAILPVCTAFGGQSFGGVKQPIDHSQDGPFGMYGSIPKWTMDAMVAANCYQTGMMYLNADPKLAVKAFLLGLQYAQKAGAAGGGTTAESISRAISKELSIAMANAGKADKPDSDSNSKKDNNTANADVNDIKNNFTSNGGKYVRASSPKNSGSNIKVGNTSSRLGNLAGSSSGQRGSM